ncbi:hypothetical protein [Actinomadura rubteroloni]|uniref:hypothetical protein n=1 Tax=Actinomadura rubteroloni TaxID=1926885 RepID=UPI000CD82632|nr:hypothetical protein [Actinomadura rubteroloni]
MAARGLEAYGRSLTASPVHVWCGKHTGSWWAFLDGRLIERPTALGVRQEIEAMFSSAHRTGEAAMTPHIPVRADRDAGRQPRRRGHFFRALFAGRPAVAG